MTDPSHTLNGLGSGQDQGDASSSRGRSAGLRPEPANGLGLSAAATIAAHTPGPWGWMGNQHGIYLATEHSGRLYVMAFRRMGTQAAQPAFRSEGRMVPASDLVKFEVGDGTARGFVEAKSDPSVYRFDVTDIDCPDARLIAAAPDLYAACQAVVQSSMRNAAYDACVAALTLASGAPK